MVEFRLAFHPCQPWLKMSLVRNKAFSKSAEHTSGLFPFGDLIQKFGRAVSLETGLNGYMFVSYIH